ncbi:folylpolyglutamate synthase [Faecalibacterium gallinarum]|uniref:Folylpolyglutamate synthase n=1 Tax=Faecalibacterium gallinarum TaxID=2903556 RepID=A0AA37MZ87_9FIRM|nr:folylpolyglutamate synthase [Faecalibacterium gallinarum]GJN65866.1 hypothetical protein JCM17207_24910 [Faecalibacterium gallinarum]
MTIQQANDYFASCPAEGFLSADQLRGYLPQEEGLRYIGISGTAGKTAVAALLSSMLKAAGFKTGCYHAGWGPMSQRVRIDGAPVEESLLCGAAEHQSRFAFEPLPRAAAELAAACTCFAQAGCSFAVVELPDAGLAPALPRMPVCAVTHIGPDESGRSLERLAHDAAAVLREGSICVTAPDQPKAALTEIIVAAGKTNCELVVPDAEDIKFLKAHRFASQIDYGGYEAPLAFLGRHAACNAAVAVELALALWRKGVEISDEAILAGLAQTKNQSSIRVLRQRPLVILDACHTPQQAAALVRVLKVAKVEHMSAVVGLPGREGTEAFLTTLETGLLPGEEKGDKKAMPGMSDSVFDRVYFVAPAGVEPSLTRALAEAARYHFEAEFCPDLAQALEQARAAGGRGMVVCGREDLVLEAAQLLG